MCDDQRRDKIRDSGQVPVFEDCFISCALFKAIEIVNYLRNNSYLIIDINMNYQLMNYQLMYN